MTSVKRKNKYRQPHEIVMLQFHGVAILKIKPFIMDQCSYLFSIESGNREALINPAGSISKASAML